MKKNIYNWINLGAVLAISVGVAAIILIGSITYKSLSNTLDNVSETEVFDQVFRTEFDGHTYIVFKTVGGLDIHDISGVVHDPDCKCFNK